MPTFVIKGIVFTGKGEGKKFISLPWVKHQIYQKLGFNPFEGTLNLKLNEQGIRNKELLRQTEGIRIEPQKNYCPGIAFKANINHLNCAIIIPLIPNYSKNTLEIIAPQYLRGHLGLIDGNLVEVTITF